MVENTGLQVYIDKTKQILEKFGLMPKEEDSKLVGLLNDVLSVDEAKVVAIAEVVKYSGKMAEFVRSKTQEMHSGTRYEKISKEFNTLRGNVNKCIGFWADDKLSLFERAQMGIMFLGGDITSHFKKIENTYKEICSDVEEQLVLEQNIFDAYSQYRVASLTAEGLAKEVLTKQKTNLDAANVALDGIKSAIAAYTGDKTSTEYSALMTNAEIARQAQVKEDGKYQLLKDVTESLSINNKVSDALMLKIEQSHKLKNQVYRKGVTFFGTCQVLFATLNFGYNQIKGQNEMNKSVTAMDDVLVQGVEDIANMSGKVDAASIKAGYGTDHRIADSYKALEQVIEKHEVESQKMIAEERANSTAVYDEMGKIEQESRVRRLQAQVTYQSKQQAALPSPQ